VPGAAPTARPNTLAGQWTDALVGLLFLASGFAALNYQIAWQRALFGWYGVDLDSVSAIVSIFMLGLGVGALAGGWLADRFPARRIVVFSAIEALIAVFGFFSLEIIDGAGALLYDLPLPMIVAITFAVFLIPTCAMGATLPVLVTELASRNGNIGVSTGQLYYVNTMGAAAGAFAAAYLLLPMGGLDGAVMTAAAINLTIALLAALALGPRRQPSLTPATQGATP
jgi:predicted membrane-bound spermidine synthase